MDEGNPIKYSDLVIDDGAIDKLIAAIDKLEKHFLSAQKKFRNEIEKTRKSASDFTDATDDQEAELEKLEKQLEKLIKANKELQDAEGQATEQKKKAVKLAKEEQKLRQKLIELTDDQAVANEELRLEIAKQRREVKEQAKENKGLTGEYDKQSKRLRDLRKQYKNLAAAGQENTQASQELLEEVTALDQKLKDIDKSVGQTQREVGNYKDQVKEALKETNLWTESIGGAVDQTGILSQVINNLNVVINIVGSSFKDETEEVVTNTVASEANETQQKKSIIAYLGLSRAVKTTSRSMKVFNNVLKASAIGAFIALLASLVAFFKKTQEGADALARANDRLAGATEEVSSRFAKVGDQVGKTTAESLTGALEGFIGLTTGAPEKVQKALEKVGKGFKDLGNTIKEQTDGIGKAALKAANDFAAIGDQIRKNEKDFIGLREEVARLNAESEKSEEIEADATKSFAERTQAIQDAARLQSQAAEKNLEIVRRELAVEEALFKFKKDRKTQTREDEQELSNKRIEFIEAEKDAELKALAIRRVANQLLQDELEKNLDILIDGFDNQKSVNERLIADEKKRFDERRKLILETQRLQRKVLGEEVAEIKRVAKTRIDIDDLIKTSDAKVLNEKIRAIGLSEILEGRLLEVVREARTQESELNETLIDLDRQRLELRKEVFNQLEDLRAKNIENEKQQALELQKIEEKRAIEEIEEQQKLFKKTSEEFQALEKQKTEIRRKGVEDRETIDIQALERQDAREQKAREIDLLESEATQEEINEELTKLKIEQLQREIDLEKASGRDAIDKELELARLKNKIAIDAEKEKADKIQDIQDATAQAVFDSFQMRLDKQINELDRLEDKQEAIVDRQEARAQAGLENNLAFEEQALAEIEQKKIQSQKKQIQLDKIRALYSAYSAASASGDESALVSVLRDFSILQGLESAILSFGTGTGEHGDVSDFMDANKNGAKGGNSISNGVVRGESHAKRGKGIPVLVEGNEGIWKGSTMAKFGKGNFVALTKAIDSGMIGSNFMQPQVNALQVMQSGGSDPRLLDEMKATRKAIENKPEQIVDVEKVTRGVMDFIDERKSGNKRLINRHRVTKNRI